MNTQFDLPGILKLDAGAAHLPRINITGPHATATVYPHGAHVALFQPQGARPVLFMSQRSQFAAGKPIRGGVPIIFPWFGPHPTDATAPAHGIARLRDWQLLSTALRADGVVELVFALAPCLHYRVAIGRQLELSLAVHNPGATPLQFEEALHTYFAVSDIRHCTVTGLEDARYDSQVEQVTGQAQGPAPLAFTAETDRLYPNTRTTCVIHDPGWQRRITVAKSGSDTTVVWNPWIAKAKAMPDFGDDEWPGMLCIETVNARANAVTLPPGQTHTLRAVIQVG